MDATFLKARSITCILVIFLFLSSCDKAIDNWVEKKQTEIILEGYGEAINLRNKINNAGGANAFLIESIKNNSVKDIKYALEYGANPNGYLNNGYPLIVAYINNSYESIDILLNSGANIDLKYQNMSPLFFATAEKNYDMARYLVNKGADVNTTGDEGLNLIAIALMGEDVKILKLLLNNGADLNYYGDGGKFAFDIAKELNNVDMLNILNEHIAK